MTNKYRKIFVMFPQGVRTGGPEALVQLVHCLRSLNQEAYLVPLPGTEHAEHVEQFQIYDSPIAPQVEDKNDCAVIFPEMAYSEVWKLREAERYMWWLSVDFSTLFFATKRLESLQGKDFASYSKRLILRILKLRDASRVRRISREKSILHLAQSHYARSFLYAHSGIVASIVSDFTSADEFVRHSPHSSSRGKRVAFNPAKGADAIAEIRERLRPDWDFVPIQGMTRDEVIQALGNSAVYLDLGNHPGKDRMPREAALAGAVTIVARRGAGAFFGDTPLSPEFKVNTDRDMSVDAVRAVTEALSDIELAAGKQHQYRSWIAYEKERFSEEVRRVFVEGRSQDDSLGLEVTSQLPGMSSS